MYINHHVYRIYIYNIYKQNVREKDAVMSSAGVRLAEQDSIHGETLMHIQQSKSSSSEEKGPGSLFLSYFPPAP